MLQFSNPRFDTNNDGRACLSIKVNGMPAKISPEQKAFKDGFIFLGSEFEESVSPLTLPAELSSGRLPPLQLFGFSNDPRLIELFRQFWAEVNSDSYSPHDVSFP